MDEHLGRPGDMTIYELTEAYQDAHISQNKGVFSGNSNAPGCVYSNAHRRASPQGAIIHQTYYDKNRNITTDVNKIVRAVWSVINRNDVEKIAQIFRGF